MAIVIVLVAPPHGPLRTDLTRCLPARPPAALLSWYQTRDPTQSAAVHSPGEGRGAWELLDDVGTTLTVTTQGLEIVTHIMLVNLGGMQPTALEIETTTSKQVS